MIDVWRLLFDQTPVVLRWVLGVLSAGVFTLATYIYRRNQRRMEHVEQHIDRKIRDVEQRMEGVNAASQRRDEHIINRLEIIDGRIITVLNTLANNRH